MRILCVFGEHQYGDPARGAGLEATSFLPALRELGHEVQLFDSWAIGRYRSNADLNQQLLDQVASWRPDLLVSVLRDVELWSETLTEIRGRYGVRAVSWTTDDTWKWGRLSRYIARDYDGMVTTCEAALPAYARLGVPTMLSQWAANPGSLQTPLPASACSHPVSFVGIAYGDRRRLIAQVRQAGIQVACFGHNWPAGSVSAGDIPGIMRQSVISLNFSKGLYGGANQIKARVFEVPGAGGFLLTEDSPGLDRYYRLGSEIDTFADGAALIDRIRFYLSHPEQRDRAAHRAHQRTVHEHTYRHRMEAVVAFAAQLPLPGRDPGARGWPEVIASHRPRWYLTWARALLIGLCRLVWGRQRSWAYARRIACELGWRLGGRGSFRARGWIGRMFPY